MRQHFVTFYSLGTFLSETTCRPIDSWDITKSMEMARTIKERYDATPFGFRFSTHERGDMDMDSKKVADHCDEILLSNMRSNGWKRVIVNTNSFKLTQAMNDDDVVLQYVP